MASSGGAETQRLQENPENWVETIAQPAMESQVFRASPRAVVTKRRSHQSQLYHPSGKAHPSPMKATPAPDSEWTTAFA